MLKLIRVCSGFIICVAWILSAIGLMGGLTEFFVIGHSDILTRSLSIFAFAACATIVYYIFQSKNID